MIKLFLIIIEIFKVCVPITISVVALIESCRYRDRMREFEDQKERIRIQERKTDEIVMRLNRRANLIPYFHLQLNDSKIEKITDNYSERMKLVIGLINIGKESAANIVIWPMGKESENFFVTDNAKESSYFICDYLNRYYALPKEDIEFSLTKEIPTNNHGEILSFISFKIRFRDLLGNLYEQKFKFGYDNYILKGFNLNSYSSVPTLVEE